MIQHRDRHRRIETDDFDEDDCGAWEFRVKLDISEDENTELKDRIEKLEDEIKEVQECQE